MVLTVFLAVVFVVYYFTQFMYVHTILKLKSENELKKREFPKILESASIDGKRLKSNRI